MPEDGAAVTVSGLNSLRREALEASVASGKEGPIPFETRLFEIFSTRAENGRTSAVTCFFFPNGSKIFDRG